MFFPHIPYKTIDKVNSAIDNPNRKMVMLQNSGIVDPRYMDAFGLSRHGHRKYNHSIPSAFMASFMVDPEHATELAMAHLFVDKLGNYLHDIMGTEDKEVAEALFNQQFARYRALTSPKGRNRKKMF
jgi:hypothetical protein